MPWRGPEYDGEFPSLGWDVLDWAEQYLSVPDGPMAGEPLVLTDEQTAILVRFYGLDDRGRFLFRRAAVRRAQGWGKSPLLACIALAELCGPAQFDGWSADGEPVAREHDAPWVQVAAVSEDQTDNTYAAAYEMANESELARTHIDIGKGRMERYSGFGKLEPVTSAAGSRLGQRITFAVLDETHLWTPRNGGRKLANTIRRNAGKMNGRTFESTNAHLVGEDSVAERSLKAALQGAAGLLYDAVEAPHVEDLTDKEAVARALVVAYGDSAKWVDLDRLVLEVSDPATDPDDARRFYFNQPVSGGERPVDISVWESLAVERDVADGELVGVGFDGSISDDKTVLWGCTRDLYLFEIAVWERPPNVQEWRVPRAEVDATVRETFAKYTVGRMLCDPAKWYSEIEAWAAEYGDDRVVVLDTNQARRFAPACDRFATGVRERAITHDGSPRLTQSLAACAKKQVRLADDADDGRTKFVIVKADTRKIDEAVAAVNAVEAAATMDVPTSREPTFAWV
jgi:hypothetical protein